MPVNNNALASLLGFTPVPHPSQQVQPQGLLDPRLEAAIARANSPTDLRGGFREYLAGRANQAAQGLAKTATVDLLGAPVDLANLGASALGVGSANPVGGSQWLEQKAVNAGVFSPSQSGTEDATRFLGGFLDPGTMATSVAKASPWLQMGAATAGSLGGLLAMTSGGSKEASKLAQMYPNQAGIVGFHGSPHDFDAFKLDKIGTGEGAQAYGHGLYFAENPEVAKQYRPVRAYVGKAMKGQPIDTEFDPKWIAQNAADEQGGVSGAIEHLTQVLERRKGLKAAGQAEENSKVAEAIELLRSGGVAPNGKLYTVDLPDSSIEKMLDWDKPLAKQSPEVKQLLKDAGLLKQYKENLSDFAAPPDTRGAGRAQNLYAMLSHKLGGDAKASEYLRSLGIPGIKYLDQGSRGSGNGTRNFVVFDETLPKIVKKE